MGNEIRWWSLLEFISLFQRALWDRSPPKLYHPAPTLQRGDENNNRHNPLSISITPHSPAICRRRI